MVVDEQLLAPTVDDARRAADALTEAGAVEVLLYGSVAKGTADAYSDIDVVVIFDDIDYGERHELKQRLERIAGEAAAPWPVQVNVTDRPEWQRRTLEVSSSFERNISNDTINLAAGGGRDTTNVRWQKQMARPMNNPEEALNYLERIVIARIDELAVSVRRSPDEDEPRLSPRGREVRRFRRMVRVCEDSSMGVELSLKSLGNLHGLPIPGDKELRDAGHDIGKCLELIPEPPRAEVRAVVEQLGLDLATMSSWRVQATYLDDDEVWGDADLLVDDYVKTLVAVVDYTVTVIQKAVGDNDRMSEIADYWQYQSAFLLAQDIRLGVPRDYPQPGIANTGLSI